MNLTGVLDYVIAILGFFIIVVSFAWNIYDVFLRKSIHHFIAVKEEKSDTPQSTDSAIR